MSIPLLFAQRKFSPRQLFATLQGAWLEPTQGFIFTDTAGTSAITAGGQAIARIADQSGGGNNATQATAGNRPTYQLDSNNLPLARHDATDSLAVSLPSINVRRNLSVWSDDFSSTYCLNAFVTYYANQALAPDGTATADLLVETTDTGQHRNGRNGPHSITAGQTYTASVYVKRASGTRNVILRLDLGTGAFGATGTHFNLTTLVITPSAGQTGTITPLNDGWFRITMTATSSLTYTANFGVSTSLSNGTTPANVSYAGDGTSGIYIWGAQLELGSVATDYQKITDWTSELYTFSGSVYFATPQGMSALHGRSMGTTYTLPALSTDIYSWIVVPQRLNSAIEGLLERYMLRKAGLAVPDYLTDDLGEILTDDIGDPLLAG